jgi:N-acetylglucosamine malate deacetylase 1
MKKVLILSPHTDDAELGAGGYISKLIGQGVALHWMVFSSARESLPEGYSDDTLANEFHNVMNSLNISEQSFSLFDYKVRRLNEYRQDVLESLVSIRHSFNPDLVIGPSLNDFHQDHQVVANEMIRAFKSVSSIICYELPWNHIKFENQFFVPLEEVHIENKLKMLWHYKSQKAKGRFYFSDEFIKGLASTRGVQVSTKYAEAFEVVRWIV